jgi:hypothetical protein
VTDETFFEETTVTDRKHPLYNIVLRGPGEPWTKSWVGRPRAKLWTLNETKGHAHLMDAYITPEGNRRTTLRADIREHIAATQKGDVRILAGYGLVWVSFYDLHDATLFFMFHL